MDDANSRSGRLQFAYQPIENLELHVTAQHTVQTALGNSANQKPYVALPPVTCTVGASTFPCSYVDHSQIPDLGDPQDFTKPQYSQLDLDDTQFRWDARYTASFATITYLGGYDRLEWDSWNPAFNYDTPINVPNPRFFASVYNQTEKPKTTNHELRFQSADPAARFTWQFGVFYFQNENKLDSHNQRPNGTPNPQTVIHFNYDITIESLAEMAQVAFNFTDEFKVTAGFRHNDDEKTRVGNIFFTNTLPPGTPPVVSPTSDVSQDTYHFGLDWQFSPASLLYGKYDTGYKAGGFTDIAPYGPEEVETYEVGSKNRFLDDRMQLNIAAYYSDYTGQQVQQIVSGGGGLRIENAGETRIQGVEADWVMAYESGQVELSLAYLDAEFTKFDLAYGAPVFNYTANGGAGGWVNLPTVNVDLAGNRPQQAPEWTVSGAVEHTFVGVVGGDLRLRLQGRYQTEQFYTFFNRPNDTQEAYGTLDFIGTYTPNGGPWQIQAYWKNLTDETVFSNAGPNDRGHVYAYTYQPPMTYGARVSYNW
jgi:iron complex outermembrane recepter protein